MDGLGRNEMGLWNRKKQDESLDGETESSKIKTWSMEEKPFEIEVSRLKSFHNTGRCRGIEWSLPKEQLVTKMGGCWESGTGLSI